MRTMLDALYPNNIPVPQPAGTIIAAYLGHASNPQSYAQAVARFPGHQVVSIASHNAVDAQILDIENGAVDPTDYTTINAWDARQLARGVHPTHYCNTSTYPTIVPHLLVLSNWWAAKWGGGATVPAGAVGVQYDGAPGFDISTMFDHIPGIDSESTTPTEDDMIEIWWSTQPGAAGAGAYAVSSGRAWPITSDTLTALRLTAGRPEVNPVGWEAIGPILVTAGEPVAPFRLTGTFDVAPATS